MAYPYSMISTAVTGNVLTATDYNNEHQNHINNNDPAAINDASANVTAMQATVDPGGVGTESLAADLAGELQRLRYVLTKTHGGAQWYSYPATNALLKGGGTMSGAIAMGASKITGLATATASGDALAYGQQLPGTATNDDAATGKVGEVVRGYAAGVSAAGSTQFGNVTSISLTAGDWDISGNVIMVVNGAGLSVAGTNHAIAISINTGNTLTDHVLGDNLTYFSVGAGTQNSFGATVPAYRLSLAAPATVYLKAQTTFGSGTPQWSGRISARRAR